MGRHFIVEKLPSKHSIHNHAFIVDFDTSMLRIKDPPVPRNADIHDNGGTASLEKYMNTVEIIHNQGADGLSICSALKKAFNSTSIPQGEERKVIYRYPCSDRKLGNRLPRVYYAWLLAQASGAEFEYHCEEEYNGTFIANLQEMYPSTEKKRLAKELHLPTLMEICDTCDTIYPLKCKPGSLDLVTDNFRYDLNSIASKMSEEAKLNHSDIAIHVRCGDALRTTKNSYGILPHSTYSRIIREEFPGDSLKGTISIVTQPFDAEYLRLEDRESGAKCRLIIEDLVSYLRQEFPSAQVDLHNHHSDTIAMTYARLVLAKKMTICGPSTFCKMASVASVGTGYLYTGKTSSEHLWSSEMARRYNDVKLYRSEKLVSGSRNGLSRKSLLKVPDQELLAWLRRK
jgi:hypothetical protein